jgi:hypothetical protein
VRGRDQISLRKITIDPIVQWANVLIINKKSKINALDVTYRPNINTWKCQKIAPLKKGLFPTYRKLFSFVTFYYHLKGERVVAMAFNISRQQ